MAESPSSRHQPAQEVQEFRLHRYVEPTRRLVHEHQARARDQVPRDLQALLHAAREGGRQIVDPVGVDLHRRPASPAPPLGYAHSDARPPPSGAPPHWRPRSPSSGARHAGSGGRCPSRCEAGGGAPARPSAARPPPESSRIRNSAVPPVGSTDTRQTAQHRGLPRPGLAHHTQHLARPEVEAHVEAAHLRAVALGEPAHTQEPPVLLARSHRGLRRSPQ